MGTLSKGYTFGATETVTNAKLHSLIDSGSVSAIANADIAAGAAIAESKINFSGAVAVLVTGAQTIAGAKTFSDNVIMGTANQGDIWYDDGTKMTRLTPGTSGKFLQTLGTSANPAWASLAAANMPAGSVVQVVNTMSVDQTDCTTTMPFDDTVPTYAEGTEVLSRAITPTSATNYLLIDVVLQMGTASDSDTAVSAALFQDGSGTDAAIAGGFMSIKVGGEGAGSGAIPICFKYYMLADTTSETTFAVRAGANSGTAYLNGYNNGRILGGIAVSSITITEIKV